MISTTMSTIEKSNNAGREEIVDKLHGALASFRRERDDMHRKKELSVERLRLVKDECDALTKTVRSMQAKLRQLQSSASSEGTQREMAALQQEVDRLSRETQFQHTELLVKKEKLALLESEMGEKTKALESALLATREELRIRREKKNVPLPKLTSKQQLEKMKKELGEVDNEERLWPKWSRLVEQTAKTVEMEAGELHRSSDSLRKLIAGYKKNIGGEMTAQKTTSAVGQ